MNLVLISKLLLLLAAANGAPVLATRLLRGHVAAPLDAGILFVDRKPLLGRSKTVRGVLASVLVTTIVAVVIGVHALAGAAAALAAMAGDVFSSFCKRRLGLAPSSQALGLDQIPESLLPILALRREYPLSGAEILLTVALFFAGELILSRILFAVHWRDRPY